MKSNGKDVIGWLLEDDNPSVKYWTLLNLLDYAEDSTPVTTAREQIMRDGPVPKILECLSDNGHFEDRETVLHYGTQWASYGYLPKYRATTWQVILFAELGADPNAARVRSACEYVLNHSWQPNGLFSMVGNQNLTPCFQGNMLYALAKLGYGDDPRLAQAYDMLLTYARFDDGGFVTPRELPYRGKKDRCFSGHSCYAGCLKALKAITALPREKRDARVHDFVARGAEFFLKHHVYRASHVPNKLLHRGIEEITFPSLVYGDFLEILTTLLELDARDARMNDAIALLRAKQLPNGRWRLDRDMPRMQVRLGKKHHESKWATYRARYALKLWESGEPDGQRVAWSGSRLVSDTATEVCDA